MVKLLHYLSHKIKEIFHRYRYDLGRYTIKYLSPVGYKGHIGELFKLYTAPIYETPPHFGNIWELPRWFRDYVVIYGNNAAFNRYQNELRWARVNDLKDVTYVENPNGTYHLTDYAVKNLFNDLEYNDFKIKGTTRLIAADHFTQGGIGGEHSEFIISNISDYPEFPTGIYRDIQRLNPQWRLTHFMKALFPINSFPWRLLDRWGGKDFSFLLGFKPFVIEHEFSFDNRGNIIPKKYHDPM